MRVGVYVCVYVMCMYVNQSAAGPKSEQNRDFYRDLGHRFKRTQALSRPARAISHIF